jgi:phage recombination protein Bet
MSTALTPPPGGPATDLPAALTRRNIEPATWAALQSTVYPGAKPESILMVLDYCRARKLDPLKKVVHIVPMEVRNALTNSYEWRDVVVPGVTEHRITAQRTGRYLGHSAPAYGPDLAYKGVTAPEWCAMTVYRLGPTGEGRIEFPVRTLFREVVTLTRDGKPNARWMRAPHQMLTKCCEAAGLREAFPDELGGEGTAEELEGARAPEHEEPAIDAPALPPKPDTFEPWLAVLEAHADDGTPALRQAWSAPGAAAFRDYLQAADPGRWMTIKQQAAKVDAQRAADAAQRVADAEPGPLEHAE